jgi:hypothetical protein
VDTHRAYVPSLAMAAAVLFLSCAAEDGAGKATSTGRTAAGAGGAAAAGGAGGTAGNGAGAGPATGGSMTGGSTTGGPIDPTGGGGRVVDSGADSAADGSDGRSVTPECAATRTTADDVTMVVPADIIFAIDSSGSMDEEIQFVQTFMNGFSQQIVAAGVDARVILIGDPEAICIGAPLGSGTCPNDTKLPGYVHVPAEVGSNDGLNIIIETFPQWRQHLRPGASKSFVIVTDDDATDGPNNSAAAFRANLTALDPMMLAKWTFNGVYCFTQCPDAAEIGRVYVDLVASTMGVGGDLCLQDFRPVFDALAKKIITTSGTKITCDWALPQPPAGKTFAGDLVEVRRSADGGANVINKVNMPTDCSQGGWHFDNNFNPTKILACPSTCMQMQNQMGGRIDVTYGCESVGSCVATGASTVSAGVCEWNMPMPPPGQMLDFTSVNVRYTSPNGFATSLGGVPSGAACSMFTHGWHYDNPVNPQKIVACPQTCTEIQAGGATAKVDVLFGCKTKPATPK